MTNYVQNKFIKSRYTTGEKALTRTEYNKLISVIDKLEDEVFIKLAISCGIRREDIGHGTITRKRREKGKVVETFKRTTGIKISDIDFDEKRLTFFEGKKNRNHTVPLSNDVIILIKKLINSRGKNQHEYLITFSGRTAHRKLQEYCDKAGIPRRPVHSLRGSCVKFCQAMGWSPEQVAKLIDDSIAVVQQHYATPSQSEMNEVAQEKQII